MNLFEGSRIFFLDSLTYIIGMMIELLTFEMVIRTFIQLILVS